MSREGIVVVRAGTGYQKPRCIQKGSVKQGPLFFHYRMTLQTMDITFFGNNHALLRLTPQLHLPLLLFTLSSRQYFSFPEDLNTWLSGSTHGAKSLLSPPWLIHLFRLLLSNHFVCLQFLFELGPLGCKLRTLTWSILGTQSRYLLPW